MIPETTHRPSIILDAQAKKKVINNLEMLETRQKLQEQKLLSSLETI